MQAGDKVSIKDLEKAHIQCVLESENHIGRAAKILGIDPATLYRKRRRFGISYRVSPPPPPRKAAQPANQSETRDLVSYEEIW